MSRPSFAATISALENGGIHAVDEDLDVAAVLRDLDDWHRSPCDDPDGPAGECGCCCQPWPCQARLNGEQLALIYLIRASGRAVTHARELLAAPHAAAA